MISATAAIFEVLNVAFADLDAKMTANQKAWVAGRKVAVKTFKAENRELARKNQWEYYGQLHNIAGGKTWFRLVDTLNDSQLFDFVEKNCKAIAERRNASIASKLAAANVTAVLSSKVEYTKDGFNGTFSVETDKGDKTVTIQTIYAGGYNIQCFHQRTLVRVR